MEDRQQAVHGHLAHHEATKASTGAILYPLFWCLPFQSTARTPETGDKT